MEQWNAVPALGQFQIVSFLGCFELLTEMEKPHYMKGGKPGVVPYLFAAGDDATREAVLNADDECNDANDDDDLFLLLDALVSWSSSFLDDFVPTTFSRRRRR